MDTERSINLFESTLDALDAMDDTTAMRYIRILRDYSFNGISPEKSDPLYPMFCIAKYSIDRRNEIVDTKKERAKKGAEARWNKKPINTDNLSNANASQASISNANACLSIPKHRQAMPEKEKEKEKEYENEKEQEKEYEKEVNIINARDKSRAGAGGSSDVAKINTIISEFTSDDELKLALHEFVKMRTKIKKPITPYGLQQALKKLRELGSDQTSVMVKVINQSIEKSWQSFYPIDNRQPRTQAEPPKQRTMQERFNAVTELARQKGIIT